MNIDLTSISIGELITHGISLGLFAGLIRKYNAYRDVEERINILWRSYCEEKDIHYTPAGGK